MAYSAKRRRLMEGGALALVFGGGALILMLKRNQFGPAVTGLLSVLVGLVACGMALRAYSYMDEVQRRTQQTHWFWGSMIGFAAFLPVATALGPNTAWLDAAIQFFFHHPGTPRLYFGFGAVLPIVFQAVGYFALNLLGKLPRGSNA